MKQILFHTITLTLALVGPPFLIYKLKQNIRRTKASGSHFPGLYQRFKEQYFKDYDKNLVFCRWVNKFYDDLYEVWQDDTFGVCFDTFCIYAYYKKIEFIEFTSSQVRMKIRKFWEKTLKIRK